MAGVREAGNESAKLCGRRCHARAAWGWPAAACEGEHRAPGTHEVMRALGASASLILRSAGLDDADDDQAGVVAGVRDGGGEDAVRVRAGVRAARGGRGGEVAQ